MSKISDRSFLRLAGVDLSSMSIDELRKSFLDILGKGIHGICFSAYLEGQGPGSQLSEQQIRDRMEILQPYVKWVRSFSCVDGNELIPKIAREFGLKTLVGVWLGDDLEKNEEEIQGAIEVCRAGHVDILAVGNEVLLRGDLGEDAILDYMARLREAVPGTQMGYVDAYYEFTAHPRLTQACDVLLINCYPFWEGCPIDHSLVYMKEMYRIAERVAAGKKIIIAETGWPNLGSAEEGAKPSKENALKYFIDTYNWAENDNIEVFYFSSFDETWKIEKEGDVGAYWGLWDKDGNLKY